LTVRPDRFYGGTAIKTLLICFIVGLALAPGASAQTADSGPLHGSISAGYTYLWADQGGGERVGLSGWFFKPDFTIGRGYSAFLDATNYYGANRKGSLNSHGLTAGIQKGFFKHARVQPSVFAEAGDLRVSNANVITNSLLINIGGNLLIPVYKRFGIAITPGEWVWIHTATGNRNDFNAKAGFNFRF
jgi:hypothetical protein